MADAPAPVPLDLTDFDAVGVVSDVVVSVRAHAIENEVDASAEVSAPHGWHRVMINCSASGKTVLRVRFVDLTKSRANNVSKALVESGWQTDEDQDGASRRYPSGTESIAVAFDALAAVSLGGAPSDTRLVAASDRSGQGFPL